MELILFQTETTETLSPIVGFLILQELREIYRKEECLLILLKILGINQVSLEHSAGKFLAEGIKRGMTLVTRRFYLYWTNLVATREDEVNLVVVFASFGRECIIEKFVARCS